MAPRSALNIASLSSSPSIFTHCSSCLKREFSSTPAASTKLRRQMFAWLEGPGESFRHPLPGSTNYLSAYDKRGKLLREGESTPETQQDLRPFPLNPHFLSESILSEPLREEVWRRVMIEKKSVRTVSVELGIEMRRVGAVVRLVELEKQMREETSTMVFKQTNYNSLMQKSKAQFLYGLSFKRIADQTSKQKKPLALPYARAIHQMVPITPFEYGRVVPHESINDLPVHPLTDAQIFYPTSESRAFNRTDAGRVFSGAPRLPDEMDVAQGGTPPEPWTNTKPEKVGRPANEIDVLKPADARIPHPHLIAYAKDKQDPELRGQEEEIKKRYAQRLLDDAEERAKVREKKIAQDEAKKSRIEAGRWQFVVTDIKSTKAVATDAGLKQRGAIGDRYGLPFEDRKKGMAKIPQRVPV